MLRFVTIMFTYHEADRLAAAMMGMSTVYFRFTHIASNPEYATMRAGLRMNVTRAPGVDRASFELAALAVSALNGCRACVDAHEMVLRQLGLSAQGVQSAVRIAATVHAAAVVLEQASA